MPRLLDYPPVWLLAFMALGWGLAELWSPLGERLVWPGRGLVVLALLLIGWSALAFARARTTIVPGRAPSALVETGPYRLSRNPIYLADLMILAGWVLLLGQPLGLVLLWPLAVVLRRRFIEPEEALLAERLGAPYRAYLGRVRRWI